MNLFDSLKAGVQDAVRKGEEKDSIPPTLVREQGDGLHVGTTRIGPQGAGAEALTEEQVAAIDEWAVKWGKPGTARNVHRRRESIERQRQYDRVKAERRQDQHARRAAAKRGAAEVRRLAHERDRSRHRLGKLVAEQPENEAAIRIAEAALDTAERRLRRADAAERYARVRVV
jgi:hypothetical protein